MIPAATEQWEHDTSSVTIQRSFDLLLDEFPSDGVIRFPVRPVTAVVSVTYYDANNVHQTLSTDTYGLDTVRRELFLEYDKQWPVYTERRNGIAVSFTAGAADASGVPAIAKQAILLQVGKWFEIRDMIEPNEQSSMDKAYERLVRRYVRASYP